VDAGLAGDLGQLRVPGERVWAYSIVRRAQTVAVLWSPMANCG